VSTRPFLAGFACTLTLIALSPVAAQDWGRPEGYENRRVDVGMVNYNGGRFEYQGRGRWIEYGPGQQIKANFDELSRSADWIDLNDSSRDVQVRLNLKSRAILFTERGGPYRFLYAIQSVSNGQPRGWGGGRPGGGEGMGYRERPRNEVQELEAGQWLVNQFDAQRICPGVASRAGGEWTGQFRTTRATVMSVCSVRFG
jgi:Mannan-binding protein